MLEFKARLSVVDGAGGAMLLPARHPTVWLRALATWKQGRGQSPGNPCAPLCLLPKQSRC